MFMFSTHTNLYSKYVKAFNVLQNIRKNIGFIKQFLFKTCTLIKILNVTYVLENLFNF